MWRRAIERVPTGERAAADAPVMAAGHVEPAAPQPSGAAGEGSLAASLHMFVTDSDDSDDSDSRSEPDLAAPPRASHTYGLA